ncbi:MAG: putative AAA+ superfamily ATPase [Candidatus Omnitrophota bacterium]
MIKYTVRDLEKPIKATLKRGKSILLFGARQTGKTTLIKRLEHDLYISLAASPIRIKFEKDPGLLIREIQALEQPNSKKPLIIIDEVQKVPALLDSIQYLIDENNAQFILTGSSARKLTRGPHINLLPGRVVVLRLDPYNLSEHESISLNHALIYGSLPGILATKNKHDRETDLISYVDTYLEEEVRAEAIVRNIGAFARFLELAASESGNIINLHKLSTEIGVAHTTISAYYQILEDCLIAHRVEPITQSKTRKKLTKSQKYLFFDLGVRRIAAKEGIQLPRQALGHIFEQMVGLELIRMARLNANNTTIKFWRDPGGPEVDWIIENNKQWLPIEVKWTDNPQPKDIRHLKVFLNEYSNTEKGYIICRCSHRLKMSNQITAIPWQDIPTLFK